MLCVCFDFSAPAWSPLLIHSPISFYKAARSNSSEAFEQATRQSKLLTNAANPAQGNAASASGLGNTATTSAFGALPATAKPAFGQSPFGQAPFSQPAFGQSAFGQTSTPASTSFGQPAGGAQPTSTFGQPSTASTISTSAFGQTGQLGASGSSIIKPASGAFSAFAGTGASAFGAGATPSNANEGSGGGGSGFSAFAGQPSAFGLSAARNTDNNTATGESVFGQPAFGQPANMTNAFGAPSTSGQQQQQGGAFSSLTNSSNTTSSVFGSFGDPTPMSAPTANQSASVFHTGGQMQPQGVSAFANLNTTSPASQTQSTASVFGQPAQSNTLFPSSGLAPSISMASSTSGGVSALPVPSPMSTFNPSFSKQQTSPLPSTPETTIDFAAAIAQTTYRPGSTPYDSQLPPNYGAMLPPRVGEAFKRERFSWAWKDDKGAVPEWVPPVDVR